MFSCVWAYFVTLNTYLYRLHQVPREQRTQRTAFSAAIVATLASSEQCIQRVERRMILGSVVKRQRQDGADNDCDSITHKKSCRHFYNFVL